MKIKAWFDVTPEWTAVLGGKPNEIMLSRDWVFYVNGTPYVVPRGYICDGASIPRAFWWVPGIGTPTQGVNAVGAWAHDPLFLTHVLTFTESNEVAFQLWLQAQKSKAAARTMWLAISSPAGLLAWRNTDKDRRELAKMRDMIRARPDRERFTSLWFAEAT